ncbi:hypothetical protein Y032_0494g2458 [Ancylostoma ceylanicum]|uniref:Uncharacterized protein n=1 Tax=Ancylostoma ceylanicum TaxID=53326 RepID=A0A016WUZ8_9BILA|nr:hypothetical protein Y032_0494g2458 [Ancylostoma ceylanicum]
MNQVLKVMLIAYFYLLLLQNACDVGCGGRASISQGPFSFVDCHRNCDSKFGGGNETMGESGAHVACSYACSLPVSRSVFMSVNYANGEKPVVKIVRKEGDEVSTSIERAPLTGDVDVDRFVANILGDMNRQLLALRNPFNPVPSEQQDINTSRDMMMGPGHGHMMAMHDRMNEMLAAFSRQFFEGIRRQMHRQHHLAMHRPAGHDNIAHMGPEIGNMLSNGEPVIITHPLSTFDEDEARVRPIKVVRYQMSSNHPPSVFYWIMIIFGIGALLLTLYASVIFFRVMRSAAYRRISNLLSNKNISADMRIHSFHYRLSSPRWFPLDNDPQSAPSSFYVVSRQDSALSPHQDTS